MLKLIVFLAAATPIFLFVRAVFFKRSTAMRQAFAELKRQIDYLSWMLLFLVACGIAYSLAKLIYSFWS